MKDVMVSHVGLVVKHNSGFILSLVIPTALFVHEHFKITTTEVVTAATAFVGL